MAKDECYPEDIRDQFKTLVIDNMQPNNNLYEDVVVIYKKLIKNSDPEKFFSEFYGKIVLQSEKYVDVKNPQSTLITSKTAEKLLHYFNILQHGGEGSLSSSSETEQHISLSERELHGLQYLPGYAVSNLMKKVKSETFAEKHFRNVTKKINLQKIPTDEIINCLLENPDVISNYNSLAHRLKVPFQKKYLKMCWKKC